MVYIDCTLSDESREILDELILNNHYNEIKKILLYDITQIINYNNGSSNNIDCNQNIDNNTIDKRIWLDNESDEILDALYYIFNYQDQDISILNTNIIISWLNTMKNYMGIFTDRTAITATLNIECSEKKKYLTIKILPEIWDRFYAMCKRFGITVQEGFKLAFFNFIEERVYIYQYCQEYLMYSDVSN